jgi:hypothetical protein
MKKEYKAILDNCKQCPCHRPVCFKSAICFYLPEKKEINKEQYDKQFPSFCPLETVK